MKLSYWPKDLLIKLIITIEKTIKRPLQISYGMIYKRQNNIYEEIRQMLPENLRPLIYRCNFQGCRKTEVYNAEYGASNGEYLNKCMFGCDSSISYCNVHDKFDYLKDLVYDDTYPVCSACKLEKLKEGYTVSTQEFYYTDTYKIKLDKLREEEKIEQYKKARKILRYYSDSKQKLINKITNINNTKENCLRECVKEHNKEFNVIEDIMRKITIILPENYYLKINTCKSESCENFMIDRAFDTYSYNNIDVASCICGNASYCEYHISHFARIMENEHEVLYCCEKCKSEDMRQYFITGN